MSEQSTSLGYIGLGLMGAPMAIRPTVVAAELHRPMIQRGHGALARLYREDPL